MILVLRLNGKLNIKDEGFLSSQIISTDAYKLKIGEKAYTLTNCNLINTLILFVQHPTINSLLIVTKYSVIKSTGCLQGKIYVYLNVQK